MVSYRDLLERLRSEPFRPFTVELIDGTRVAVTIPRMMVGEDRVLLVTKWKRSANGFPIALDWRQVPLDWIARLSNPRRRKRSTSN